MPTMTATLTSICWARSEQIKLGECLDLGLAAMAMGTHRANVYELLKFYLVLERQQGWP